MTNTPLSIEMPNGDIVKDRIPECVSKLMSMPKTDWDRGPNGEAIIQISEGESLMIRQPIEGRYFLMLNWKCPIDGSMIGPTIEDECGGNPLPIDPRYTIEKSVAQKILETFISGDSRSLMTDWADYDDMDVDWDAYV